MALYTIGDLHLSLSSDKPMDIFGDRWQNYVEKIQRGFSAVTENDTTVLCGDLSWGMSLEESLNDLTFIHNLPGRKILMKGNHDYWWTTLNKMNSFLQSNGFDNIRIMHNNAFTECGIAICGTRGWINDDGEPQDAKVLAREAGRLEMSLKAAVATGLEPVVFIH